MASTTSGNTAETAKASTGNVCVELTIPGNTEKKPEKDHVKKQNIFDLDFCWKITITLAVLGLVIFAIFHSTLDKSPSNTSNTRVTQHPSASAIKTAEHKLAKNVTKCTESSIKDSYASFSFIPSINTQFYKTNGVEFSFQNLIKTANLGHKVRELNHSAVPTSRVHYYYNIDRCRIGGGVEIKTKPYIRGPLSFAINEECNRVYYFTETLGWVKYKSAKSITCTNHGQQFCAEGTLHKNKWTFSNPENQIAALEFNFEKLAQKLKKRDKELIPIQVASSTEFHYLLNMKTCVPNGLNDSSSLPPLILAVDNDCTNTYVFNHETSTWQQKAIPLFCSWNNHSWCENNALANSSASFQFISGNDGKLQTVKVNGVQYHFINLLSKLNGLITDDIPKSEIPNSQDGMYYLNVHRCSNGGLSDLGVSPQIRGPLIFAVSGNCTKVHYYSSTLQSWKTYNTASKISCFSTSA